MTHSGGTTPPAGWFPDPGGAGLRWWDGSQWTEHTHVAPFAQPYPYPYARPVVDPAQAVRDERRMAGVARHVIVVYGLLMLIGGYLVQRLFGSFVPLMTDSIRRLEAGGQPDPRMFPLWGPEFALLQLFNLVQLGALVVLLVWVYRAAKAGAALGIPARHSPGWAVGWWFVPVVNLWFPAEALVDLLPRDHPMRRTIIRLWIAAIVGYVVGLAGLMMSMFGSEAGGVIAVLGYLVVAVTLALGRTVIDSVLECHEQLAAGRNAGATTQYPGS